MRSGFFNSTITGYDEEGMPIFDRAEDATFFAKYFSRIVGNGVFADPGDGMMVQASNGMNLVVKPGVCFINGYMGWLESDQVISVDAAHAILDRIDMIVARYDGINREIGIHYIKGTESSSPVPPDIERTDTGGSDIYDLALAQIYISKRVTTITQANITDLRLNNEVCGIVTSPIEHLDTSEVNAQLTAAFNEWFDWIKGQLSEDAAGNLQNQIDEHKADNMMHNQAGSIQVWPGSTAPEGLAIVQWAGSEPHHVCKPVFCAGYYLRAGGRQHDVQCAGLNGPCADGHKWNIPPCKQRRGSGAYTVGRGITRRQWVS